MTTMHLTLRWGLPFAAILALAAPASAASPQDQAAAEVLFNDAKKLADAGDFAQACPKFVESQRLDPTAGTALNVGKCFEGLGKVASAWGAYKDAEMIAHNAGDTAREAGAVKLSAALAPLLPKLAIVVPPVTRVPGFEVRRDGTPVGEGSYGSALPIDPGEHVIEASAPGKLGWTSRVMVSVSASITTEIPPLAAAAGKPADTAAAPFWRGQRIVGVALGAVGLVGFGVAAAFTANAATKNAQSLVNCLPASPNMCTQTGVDLRNQAFDAAHIADGMDAAGGVLLATGVIVFLTTPKGAPSKPDTSSARAQLQPLIGPGLGGAALHGVF
jgi:hypothetical protein